MGRSVRINAIFFDLGNVLLNYDARIAAKKFSKLAGVSVAKLWAHFFISGVEKAYTRGEITSYEFFAHAKKIMKEPVSYTLFKKCWNEIFSEHRGMEDLLKKLKKKYPLYLISNTNAMHFNYIKSNYSLLTHFNKTFPSHEMGCRKPDKKIFKNALKKAGFKPSETVFFDDARAFVAGARKAGMHAFHFQGKAKLLRDLKKVGVIF